MLFRTRVNDVFLTLVRLQASISIMRVKGGRYKWMLDAVTQLPLHALLIHADFAASS